MQVDFFDFKTGFRHLSTKQLWISKILFSFLKFPFLSKMGCWALQKNFVLSFPGVAWLIRKTLFRQFCGGETVNKTMQTLLFLNQYGVGGILDFAAERGTCREHFEAAEQSIVEVIQSLKLSSAEKFAVFKPSALLSFDVLEKISNRINLHCNNSQVNTLAIIPNDLSFLNERENQEWIEGRARVEKLCQLAADLGVKLMCDAEESWIQPAVDALLIEMMRKHNSLDACIFTTVQFYRTGRVQELQNLLCDAERNNYVVGVKAVRGAYLDKERTYALEKNRPSAVHNTKKQTDNHFDQGIAFMLANLTKFSICVATHNEESTLLVLNAMRQRNLTPENSHIAFSQLFGMSDYITFNLANAGLRSLKYIPYGVLRETIPYLMRRAQENSAVQGQTARESSLITKELKRRKKGGAFVLFQ